MFSVEENIEKKTLIWPLDTTSVRSCWRRRLYQYIISSSTCPDILFVQTFQQKRGSIDQIKLSTAMKKDAASWLQEITDHAIKFAIKQLESTTQR